MWFQCHNVFGDKFISKKKAKADASWPAVNPWISMLEALPMFYVNV
jgi:hypothetical protein